MRIITRKANLTVFFSCFLLIIGCGDKKVTPALSNKTILEAVNTDASKIKTPDDAYKALKAGNQRYQDGQFIHVHIKRLNEDEEDYEKPFVAILTCTDLKIPAEILFDVDRDNIKLFKTSANLEDDSVITSLTEEVSNHNIPLVMVLGHQDCPSLKKLLANQGSGNPEIKKKIDTAIVFNPGIHEPVYNKTAVNNVKQVANRLIKSSQVIENAVNMTTLEVKPLFYNELHRKLVFSEDL